MTTQHRQNWRNRLYNSVMPPLGPVQTPTDHHHRDLLWLITRISSQSSFIWISKMERIYWSILYATRGLAKGLLIIIVDASHYYCNLFHLCDIIFLTRIFLLNALRLFDSCLTQHSVLSSQPVGSFHFRIEPNLLTNWKNTSRLWRVFYLMLRRQSKLTIMISK